uniref:NUDIX hydrolase n=1 Tax=uncultured marine thaumarchaeote AD1000_33_B07 TaxID=1455908 RepID=A0A075FPS4_9ARCH|nr:NUDIX hydrolase [uncultured marine thaumarchaeote AD1000_33_B07]
MGFCKRKNRKNEEPRETARREAEEETGITDFKFIDGFEEYIEYDFRFKNEDIHKKVIFFLAKTDTKNIRLSDEHFDSTWLGYNDALKKLRMKMPKTC